MTRLPDGLQTFFFDFDGTLCASGPDIRFAWQQTMKRLQLDAPDFERIFQPGPSLQKMTNMLFPQLSPEMHDRIVRTFKESYDNSDFPRTSPYPGIDRWLRSLAAAGKNLGIVTNRREKALATMLKKLNWQSLFAAVFCSDRGGGLNSKPELLRLARTIPPLDETPAIMIGDTALDVETGRANGILTAGVTWGYAKPGELEESAPDYLLTLTDLFL